LGYIQDSGFVFGLGLDYPGLDNITGVTPAIDVGLAGTVE